ncbi:MAG TPA: hypothetical protein VMW41_06325 [Candidatus Bathyarchaeia archaeon]|nr:hypothetical protein [Candidatus Bathyarchaeia archaeon]
MGKKIFINLLLTSLFFVAAKSVLAVVTPSYPSCTNPTGTLKVHYDEGTHGIPGDLSEHRGSDDVFTIDNNTLYQCFCPPDGIGTQTDWWKASDLSQEEIDTLKRAGWVYIPDGALWGLDNAPYLAISHEYICGGQGGGQVLGASTGPGFDFASTGNISLIYRLIAFGLVLVICGFLVRTKSKKTFRD